MEKKVYNPLSLKADEFISDEEIRKTMDYAAKNSRNLELLNNILEKAAKGEGLTHREATVLLVCEREEINEKVLAWLRHTIKRIVAN